MKRIIYAIALTATLSSCGSLEKKSVMINPGDTKEQVIASMGVPDDRQLQGNSEAWQYCQSGAGYGYSDFRTIWFISGKVTGITSNKSSRPGNCMAEIKSIRWEEAPDATVEIRNR